MAEQADQAPTVQLQPVVEWQSRLASGIGPSHGTPKASLGHDTVRVSTPAPHVAWHPDHSEVLHGHTVSRSQASSAAGRTAWAQAASPADDGQATSRVRLRAEPQAPAEQADHSPTSHEHEPVSALSQAC